MHALEASAVPIGSEYSWQHEAKDLAPESVAKLDRDSIAIAGPFYKQSFEVYTRNPLPPFITSDSLLNGFHVLLEDSLCRWELSRAPRLRTALENDWKQLDPCLEKNQLPRSQIEPYARQLALVIGPALRLLGSKIPLGNADLEAAVTGEVTKIKAAEEVSLPPWLGPIDRSLVAIDYRRCRPTGFYAVDSILSDYYRATRWLQMIPFRSSRDNEVGAAALFSALEHADMAVPPITGIERFLDYGDVFFGNPDELPISAVPGWMLVGLGPRHQAASALLQVFRKSMIDVAKTRPRKVNDQLRLPSTAGANLEPATLRVLPAAALPDSVWFEQVNRWRGKENRFPSGIETGAWLGSDFALTLGAAQEGKGFDTLAREAGNRSRNYQNPETVPHLYFKTLAALFVPPDPSAPAFFTGEAWQRKSLQAALAGWAQFRHAWELQQKFSEMTFGIALRPSGFVEPNPEFYRRLAETEEFIMDRFVMTGVFGLLPSDQAGHTSGPVSSGGALWRRWQSLEYLTHRLEVLAEVQLRGRDWEKEDADVVKNYGGVLGAIMGYEADSVDHPQDDSPRWTAIAHDPKSDANFAVAVGRPRALYVLYPWKGTRVLCRGAVMTYYEDSRTERLTDAEWKTQFDRSPPPQQPDWIQPLLPPSRTSPPKPEWH